MLVSVDRVVVPHCENSNVERECAEEEEKVPDHNECESNMMHDNDEQLFLLIDTLCVAKRS